jgi:hypothetical protein
VFVTADDLGRPLRPGSRPPVWTEALVVVGAFGYFIRIFLWLVSNGSNDIRTWLGFAQAVDRLGVENTYRTLPLFNHPPLMSLWSWVALRLTDWSGLNFAQAFKLPSLAAEAATGALLVAIWRGRGDEPRARGAFAAYGLSLSCILISSFHGNTDALYFCLALAAAFFLEQGQPFRAGLALAGAVNVKLIPILLVPPLATRCDNWRAMRHFFAGVAVGAVPFLWAIAAFDADARSHFLRNIFLYKSNLEPWGVELAVRWATSEATAFAPALARSIRAFGDWYSRNGSIVLMATILLLSMLHWYRIRIRRERRLDSYELAALTFSLFLLFGSGFGVQYVGAVVAPLLAWNLWAGIAVSTALGLFIGSVYLHFVVSWTPLATAHLPIPDTLAGLSLAAWATLAIAAFSLLWARRPAAALKQQALDAMGVDHGLAG